MRQQLYSLQIKEKDLLSRFQEDHFEVRQIRDQIAQAKQQLTTEETDPQVTKSINESYRTLQLAQMSQEAEQAGVLARLDSLGKQVTGAKLNIEKLNNMEMDVNEKERQVSILSDNYRKCKLQLEQARIDDRLAGQSISNINVTQAATVSSTPSTPRTKFMLGLGTAAGAVLAFFSALSREATRRFGSAARECAPPGRNDGMGINRSCGLIIVDTRPLLASQNGISTF